MTSEPELIFYDGHCGLCHATVKFVLKRDRDGALFRYSPLQGDTLRHTLSDIRRAALPNSLVVVTDADEVLTRSTAVLHILSRLKGPWPALAAVMRIIPRPLRDAGYRLVAGVRRKLFATPTDACPLVPAELRKRFLP